MRLLISAFVFLLSFSAIAQADEVTIALAGPMSGEMAVFGKRMKEGADIAVADLNARGGILGKKVILLEQDDACDARKAYNVAMDLARQKVAAVIGHGCAAASYAASGVYGEHGILQIEPGSLYGPLTEDGLKALFRISATSRNVARAISLYTIKHNPNARVAIVGDRVLAAKEMTDYLQDFLKTSPVEVVALETIASGTKDFSGVIDKLKTAQPDVVICSCYTPEAGRLALQMKQKKLDAYFYGSNRIDLPEFIDILGQKNADKVVAIDYARPSQQNYLYRHLNQALWNRHSIISTEAIIGFASIELYAEAARKADGFDTNKVAEVLHRDIFPTAMGNIQFMKDGDRLEPELAAYQWVAGLPQMKEIIAH